MLALRGGFLSRYDLTKGLLCCWLVECSATEKAEVLVAHGHYKSDGLHVMMMVGCSRPNPACVTHVIKHCFAL